MPLVQHFVRAEMLPSGYLNRPCEGGGSIIHIVDHMDLEPSSVPEVLRPLYESPTGLAQKTTMAALRQLRKFALEASQSTVTGWGRRPAALRALSQRLSRGFNEAINCFNDEGWSIMPNDESSAQLAMGVAFVLVTPNYMVDVDIATHINISDDGPDRSLLYMEATDRPGLLVDIVKIITDVSVVVESGEFNNEVCWPKQSFTYIIAIKPSVSPFSRFLVIMVLDLLDELYLFRSPGAFLVSTSGSKR